MRLAVAVALVGLLAVASLPGASGHAYLSEPRSRQKYQADNGRYWPPDSIPPESEPQSANRRGSGLCGATPGKGDTYYDNVVYPVQGTYTAGERIEVSMVFTAYQQGWVVFHLCDSRDITQACFDQRPLLWDESAMTRCTGAGCFDAANPDRLYLPPRYTGAPVTETGLILPEDVSCTNCVLLWTYYTDVGTGEKFWNCADIAISPSDGSPPATPATPAPTMAPPVATPAPTMAPPVATPGPTTAPPVATPAPTAMPPADNMCNDLGSWEGCRRGTSGPCMNMNGVGAPPMYCFPSRADGSCYSGTEKCMASGPSLPAPVTPSPVTPAPTPAPTDPPAAGGQCNSEGGWDRCWPGTSGPCRNPRNFVCYGYQIGTQCYGGTEDCRNA